ncbi:PAS-domain containing protein [Chelativorans multitrophicus]|uniref:PAS-domain containing protein n=1 Tax=Chelativorans multitrophicus TaxID=449973 RepID=UPI00140D002B
MQGWVIAIIAIGYVTFLFVIASLGDRRAAAGKMSGTRPLIYALSLAIYCTSWTFFGSVGLATERAFEFLAIYIGPVLVFIFANRLLGRIIRLAKREKITSVADFLAARYGKSFAIASVAAIIATCGTIPYIALQLKAISASVSLMVEHYDGALPSIEFFIGDISLLIAMLLALFAVLFGTRHADATEHQNGLVLAVAIESVVKLAAFLAVGIAVTFFLFGGAGELARKVAAEPKVVNAFTHPTSLATWVVMTTLSACAIIMLPRQFYVTIVENKGPDELKRAAWLFPLYLVLINLFVIPIAFAGIHAVGDRTNSDLYVLAVPLLAGHDALALLAFIGGLSAATAMVIVDSVALSIMISNDLIIPLFVRRLLHPEGGEKEDWSAVILNIRRAAIFVILFAAFLYYRESTNNARLAAIGLISFAAIAQFAPAFLGGLIWRGANSRGALLGMSAGFIIWAYTLFFPSVAPAGTEIITNGLFGIEALRPQALFGTVAEPLNHGVLWSLTVNTLFFVLGSLSRAAKPLERIQAAIFVPREAAPMPSLRRFRPAVTVNDLKDTISRYLGVERTERSFLSFEAEQGKPLNGNDQASVPVIRFSEQLLTSAVGSSSARLILSLLFQRIESSPRDAMKLLDDASLALQHNRDLLQTALDQMEEGITVFDEDFRLTCWNRQFRALLDLPDVMGQVGVSLGQIVNHLIARGELPRDAEKTVLERLAAFGTPWELTLQKSARILEIRSNAMPGGGMVATYTDITARVEADIALKRANETLEQRVAHRTAELMRVNEELAQAQRLAEEANLGKTRFLAAAGHDILQPLNAARLYCTPLKEKTDRQDLHAFVESIESSLDSVETILGAVLDISRLDTGALKPSESVFRLDSLLSQIGTDVRPLADEKGLRLTIVPSSIAVCTDRSLLRRLVQNLVSNAIKYTRRGRVLVGVRRRGELVELKVIDTGIGIADDKLNIVFREFTRLDEGMRGAQGLGLGLSIVDRIARVLKLEIRLSSKPGKGTSFSVILPASSAQPDLLPDPLPLAASPNIMLAGLDVLCIDNDEKILDGMRVLLQGWGCQVHTSTGVASIGALRMPGNRPDLILADYHLDVENGLAAIGQLRHAWGMEIPAILITADRTDNVRAAAKAMGIPVLNKPIKPASLRVLLMRYRQVLAAE